MKTLQLVRRLVRHGTLPQLAAFEAVVRLGSVTRAAERLHMAQPTVSGHLRKLSESVGEPLLVQHDRRQVPTAAGLALLDAARDIFAALQRAEQTLAALRALDDGAAAAAPGPIGCATALNPAIGLPLPVSATGAQATTLEALAPAANEAQRRGDRGGWAAAAAA